MSKVYFEYDVPLWSFIISIEGCQPSKQSIWSRYILSQKTDFILYFKNNFKILRLSFEWNKCLSLVIIDVVIPDIIISGGTCHFWIGLWMFDGFYRQFWFDKCPQPGQNINENLAINFIRNWSKIRVWVRLLQLSGNSINPLPTTADCC